MPRSIYNATVTVGLVNVPIKLFSATSKQSISFREVHATDGATLNHRRIDPDSGDEIDYDDIVKGYEIGENEFVEVGKDEVKAAAGERTKEIGILEFVPAGDIDPVYFQKTYYLGAREGGEDAYKALKQALEDTGRAAIGRMTFKDREYLVAIRSLDQVLGLHTLNYDDEIVDPGDLDLATPSKGPSKKEVEMARSLVDSLADDFRPEAFDDSYRERVIELLEKKADGSLADELQASLKEAKA